MSTAPETGSFGVRPVCESEGLTIDPKTGLPYSTNRLYSGDVRPLVGNTPNNPDTGHPYTAQEIDALPSPERMHAIDFSSDPAGTLRYSPKRAAAYVEDAGDEEMAERVHAYTDALKSYEIRYRKWESAVELWKEREGVHPSTGEQYPKPKKPSQPMHPANRANVRKSTEQVSRVHYDGFDTIRHIMQIQYHCTSVQCAVVQDEFEQRVSVQSSNPAKYVNTGTPYTVHWSELSPSGHGFTKYSCAVPAADFRCLLEALSICTVRGEIVFADGSVTAVQYTPEQERYLEFCSYVHRMYVHRKIDAVESSAVGFSGKTYNRQSTVGTYTVQVTNGHRKQTGRRTGRLFSGCDREDIVNRAFLINFTPDICTACPVNGDGKGYLQMANCTVDVQEVIEELPTQHNGGQKYIRSRHGWRCTFVCQTTGQVATVFTQNWMTVCRLAECTGIFAMINGVNEENQFVISARNVRQYNNAYPYSGAVKYIINDYFHTLFKRSVMKCEIVWQEKQLRNNAGMDNSAPLYSIMQDNAHLFSDKERDLLLVELMQESELRTLYKDSRLDECKAKHFRTLQNNRTRSNSCTVGYKGYNSMTAQLYSKMRNLVDADGCKFVHPDQQDFTSHMHKRSDA
jgi:hypothetical protein